MESLGKKWNILVEPVGGRQRPLVSLWERREAALEREETVEEGRGRAKRRCVDLVDVEGTAGSLGFEMQIGVTALFPRQNAAPLFFFPLAAKRQRHIFNGLRVPAVGD